MTVLPEKVNLIAFSLGQGKHDTQPYQLVAPSFDAFCEGLQQQISSIDAVIENDDQYQQAKNEILWISAAFIDGKREKVLAQPRAWLGLDIDKCSHAQYIALRRKLRGYDAFLYTSLGDRIKGEDDRRCRIILNLNRPTEPHEIAHFGPIIARELFPGEVDSKVWDAGRIFYLTGSHAETMRTTGAPVDLSKYPDAPPPVVVQRPDVELDISADSVVEWLEEFGAVFKPHANGYVFENPCPTDYSSPSSLDDFLVQLPKNGSYDMIRVEMLHDSDQKKGWRLALEKAGCGRLVELIDQHNKDAARELHTALSVPPGTTAHEWRKKTEEEATSGLSDYQKACAECGILNDPDWTAHPTGYIESRRGEDLRHLPKIYNAARIEGLKLIQATKKSTIAAEVENAINAQESEDAAEELADAELEHKPGEYIGILGSHPLAAYVREVARSAQMPVDTTLLVGLGVVSAICSLAYTVRTHYRDDRWIPVGLYVLAEQPPGARKSEVLSAFAGTMQAELAMLNKTRWAARAKALEPLDETAKGPTKEQKEYADTLARPIIGFPLTDATAEALESKTMLPNNGLFSIISDEKRGMEQMFSNNGHQGPKNFAPLLAGYDGGRISSSRVTREGFEGIAHGSVIAFAQDGLISQVLENGNNTGIAERFIFIQEATMLGKRAKPQKKSLHFDRREYNAFVQFLMLTQLPEQVVMEPNGRGHKSVDLDDHFDLINDYLYDELEPQIGPGGLYHGGLIGGMAAKQATLITKLAAILHVYRHACKGGLVVTEQTTTDGIKVRTANQDSSTHIGVPEQIGREDVQIAIDLARAILAGNYRAIVALGLTGKNAEAQAVLDYLRSEPKKAAPLKNALAKLRQCSPFKKGSTPAKTAFVRDTIARMVESGSIAADYDKGKIDIIRLKG